MKEISNKHKTNSFPCSLLILISLLSSLSPCLPLPLLTTTTTRFIHFIGASVWRYAMSDPDHGTAGAIRELF